MKILIFKPLYFQKDVQFLTTFTQLTARLQNFFRGWLLVLGLVKCATVCVKSEVILWNRTLYSVYAIKFWQFVWPSITIGMKSFQTFYSINMRVLWLRIMIIVLRIEIGIDLVKSWTLLFQNMYLSFRMHIVFFGDYMPYFLF